MRPVRFASASGWRERQRLTNMKSETPRTDAWCELAMHADVSAVLDLAKEYEREINKLRSALQPLADLLDGDLESVGGGTLIAPTIKVQVVKDAKAALSNAELSEQPPKT